jgi:hypothetical protein
MDQQSEMVTNGSRVWAGWIAFAAVMMLFVGAVNVFEGIVALVQDERLALTPSNFVIVDVTSWGWTLVISGGLMILTGVGLLLAQTWSRIAAIVVVALHAFTQIAWLGAYPVWALLMIALDTVVLFALTARWSQAREELAEHEVGLAEGMPDEQQHSVPRERPYQPPRIA